MGAIFLTFFIRESWMADAATIAGGSWSVMQQLGIQALAVVMAIAYSAFGTLVILLVLNRFIKFRSNSEAEMKGLDNYYHGDEDMSDHPIS